MERFEKLLEPDFKEIIFRFNHQFGLRDIKKIENYVDRKSHEIKEKDFKLFEIRKT